MGSTVTDRGYLPSSSLLVGTK